MKYRLQEHISITEVDDEVVLLNLDSGAYYGLNHVGAQLMKLLGEDQTTSTAINQIAKEYDLDEAQVKLDIDALIDQLVAQKLVEHA